MHLNLETTWFVLLGVLLTGYAMLDGFDLGVGILHPLARSDRERRVSLNSIGPLWDGNEVWLVTFGGALFAAFPEAYATVFSGFYLALILLLGCLILRAVSLELRSKLASRSWRGFWDFGFFASSLTATLIFGVAVGNCMVGLPLDGRGVYVGGFFELFRLFPLLVGLLAVTLFAQHGAIFLYLKTTAEHQERVRRRIPWLLASFVSVFVIVSTVAMLQVPSATRNFVRWPWLAIVPVLNVLAIANIPRALNLRRPRYAFFSSCCCIASLVFLFGVALFPELVISNPAENSLSIYNAASSPRTLKLMLWIATIGMPCVLAYTVVIYRTYAGKVKLDDTSY